MDATNVICSLIIIFSGGVRDVISAHGVVVGDRGDNLMVDFSKELHKRKLDLSLQTEVQIVNANSCLYTKD